MKGKLFLLIAIILTLLLFVSGCNGKGSLKVIVRDQQQNLINDVYVGLYTPGFKERIRFAYTRKGTVEFHGLNSGVYSLRIVGKSEEKIKKESKIQIQNQQTTYFKINLGK